MTDDDVEDQVRFTDFDPEEHHQGEDTESEATADDVVAEPTESDQIEADGSGETPSDGGETVRTRHRPESGKGSPRPEEATRADTRKPARPDDDRVVQRTDARSGDPLDRQGGHGTLSREEAWVSETSTDGSNDGRSTTRTTFYASDVETVGPGRDSSYPGRRQDWDEMAKRNDGMYSNVESRQSQNRAAERSRWVQIFASRMGATQTHRDEVQYAIERIDAGPYKAGKITSECLIVALLSLVIDRDIRVGPNETAEEAMGRRAIERDGTQNLLEDLELDRRDIVHARKFVRKNDEELILGN